MLGLGLFAVTEPMAASSGFKSTKAIVIMVAVGLGWVLARVASLLGVRWPVIRLAVFGVAALAILKVVVLPAYSNKTVIEALPLQPAPAAAVVPPGAPPASVVPPATSAPAASVDPTVISSGMLRGIDHRASGTVNLYRQADGHVLVGLEDFDIQPGPAYALYLVPGSDRSDHDGGTRIEKLRGNRGTQFYDAPDGVDVAGGPLTVLVWCETFDVPVANATTMSV